MPSLYYGSEWGAKGAKTPGSDAPLRPALTPDDLKTAGAHPDLYGVVNKLVGLRRRHPALQRGGYQQRFVAHEQLAYTRESPEETLLVAVNASSAPVTLELTGVGAGRLELPLSPTWGRILQLQTSRP